jgi:hypothetical protein
MGGALMLPGPTPKREDKVEEVVDLEGGGGHRLENR